MNPEDQANDLERQARELEEQAERLRAEQARVDEAQRLENQRREPDGSSSVPLILGVGLVMLLIGVALGWFLQPTLAGDEPDDVIETVSVTTTAPEDASADTTAAEPEPAIDASAWAHPDGAFQVAFPADWVASEFSNSVDGTSYLRASPDPSADSAFDVGRVIVERWPDPSATPDAILDAKGPSTTCPSGGTREPFAQGMLDGSIERYGDCTSVSDTSTEFWRIAGATPDETKFWITAIVRNETDSEALDLVLDTLQVGADPSTAIPGSDTCVSTFPSTDPAFPNYVGFVNRTGAELTVFWVDPATGDQFGSDVLAPGDSIAKFNAEGDRYRFELPSGASEFSVAGSPVQCVVATPDTLIVE